MKYEECKYQNDNVFDVKLAEKLIRNMFAALEYFI